MNENEHTLEDAVTSRLLNQISGYLELGMPQEALWEIEALHEDLRHLPVVRNFQLMALISMRKFRIAVTIARDAIADYPEVSEFYIHAGAALAAMKRAGEARQIWDSAPKTLQRTSIFQLNVAFCEVELGDILRARASLQRAIAIDPEVIPLAKQEPRLCELLEKQS